MAVLLQECFEALQDSPYSQECVHAAQTSIKAAASLFAEHATEDGQLNADIQILCQVVHGCLQLLDRTVDIETNSAEDVNNCRSLRS